MKKELSILFIPTKIPSNITILTIITLQKSYMIREFTPNFSDVFPQNKVFINSNETDKIIIELANPTQVYFTNAEIAGFIDISLNSDIIANTLLLYFIGERSSGDLNIPMISRKATTADINEDSVNVLLNKSKSQKVKIHPELMPSAQSFGENVNQVVTSYKIPIFRFRKNIVAAGRYRFPFCFIVTCNDIESSSVKYENLDKRCYYSMKYKIVAEFLPLDQEYYTSSQNLDLDYIIRKKELKTEKFLKILVNNNDRLRRISTLKASNERFKITKSILIRSKCLIPKKSNITCSYIKNQYLNPEENFYLEIKFDIENKNSKDLKIEIKLLQEIEYEAAKIKEKNLQPLESLLDSSKLSSQGIIVASLLIKNELFETIESSNLAIKYSLIIAIQMNGLCGRQLKTVSFPIKVFSRKPLSKRQGVNFVNNSNELKGKMNSEDDIITMPVARFELEKCWNTLIKEELTDKKGSYTEELDDDDDDHEFQEDF